jgi:hypothetical protein
LIKSINQVSRRVPSRHLDFGRGDHGAGGAFGQRRQVYGRRAPPAVPEHSAQRGIADDVPDQLDRGGIKRRLDRDWLSFIRLYDRLKLYVPLKRIAAALMQVANGRAYLRVGVGRDLFSKKIYQSAVALKYRKHLHGAVDGFDGGRDFTRGLLGGGDTLGGGFARRFASSKYREKCPESE